jgi:purine-nucleoside phosphorylase
MLTNAAGGINPDFSAGALMMIRDHINFSGSNPLLGDNLDEFGPRFPDMTDVYTKTLREALKQRAQTENLTLREGVYAMYSGPNYETPAEIRMFHSMGADAVGISTVPEAIVARHAGMRVIGVSCITNMAAGLQGRPLDHSEVVETATRVKDDFMRLVSMAIGLGGAQ